MDVSLRGLAHRVVRRYPRDGLDLVVRRAPRFVLYSLVDEATRFYWRTRLRHRRQQLRFRAPADPWRTIRVDPQTLDTANYELSQYGGLGLLRDGDWDAPTQNVPLEEYWSVQGIRQRFVEGRDWEDTCYYRRARERLDERGEFWGYEDIETFRRERCAYVDDLFADIRDRGYRANAEDDHVVPETAFKQKPHQHLEVLVTIGRSGDVLFRDGHHRIAIARLLDVESIPVHVLGRHLAWQRTREAVADASPATLDVDRTHPDLQDVIADT